MKKFLSLVLALIMTMSLVTISAGATEYKDLTDKDEIQYEEAVAVLNRIGVITGYDDGSFRPETELTRGAAAKIIVSLLIGPEAASNLPNTYAPYPDVPANHTFAGVISYCKTAGIISGYGDGTFKPANSLTGYAFAKMLLGAVGYDSKIQGYTDTGWTMNVARDGNSAGLFNRIEFDGAAAVNREQACQLALNTLKATMVEYTGGLNVTAGDAHVTSNPTLTYKISNQEYARHISERRAGGLNSWQGNADVNNHYTVEFGEEHFKDLRMKSERANPDQFGRPSNEWSYKKVTIGTFPIEPDFKYTTQVIHNDDVKVTDAAKVRALELNGYELKMDDTKESDPVDTTLWLNGEKWTGRDLEVKNDNTDAKKYSHHLETVGDIADFTDNGTVVEVYVDEEDADFIRDVVVVKTQLMEVKSLKSEAVALKLYDDGSDENYMGFNSTPINEDVNDVQVNDDCYSALKDMKVGDIVAVIPVYTGVNSKYDVARVYVPETVSGELTNVDTYGQAKDNEEEEAAIAATVGGTDYKVALWNKDLTGIDGTKIRVTRKDVTLHLDEFGNALLAEDVGSTSNFMVVGGYHSGLVDGKVVTFVDGWDIKGNEISLNVGNIQYDGIHYQDLIGELVHYSSDTHSKYAEWDIDYLGVFDVASKRDNADDATKDYSLKASSGKVLLNGWTATGDKDSGIVDKYDFYKGNDVDGISTDFPAAATPVTKNIDVDDSGVKVIYVTMDSDDNEVDSIEIKDGMQAISNAEILGVGSKFAHKRAQACVALKDGNSAVWYDDSTIKAIVIKEESGSANLKDLVYISNYIGSAGVAAGRDKTSKPVYGYEAHFIGNSDYDKAVTIYSYKDLKRGDFARARLATDAPTEVKNVTEENFYNLTKYGDTVDGTTGEKIHKALSVLPFAQIKDILSNNKTLLRLTNYDVPTKADTGIVTYAVKADERTNVDGQANITLGLNDISELDLGDEVANSIVSINKAKFIDLTDNDVDSASDLKDLWKDVTDAQKETYGKDVKRLINLTLLFNDKFDDDGFRDVHAVIITSAKPGAVYTPKGEEPTGDIKFSGDAVKGTDFTTDPTDLSGLKAGDSFTIVPAEGKKVTVAAGTGYTVDGLKVTLSADKVTVEVNLITESTTNVKFKGDVSTMSGAKIGTSSAMVTGGNVVVTFLMEAPTWAMTGGTITYNVKVNGNQVNATPITQAVTIAAGSTLMSGQATDATGTVQIPDNAAVEVEITNVAYTNVAVQYVAADGVTDISSKFAPGIKTIAVSATTLTVAYTSSDTTNVPAVSIVSGATGTVPAATNTAGSISCAITGMVVSGDQPVIIKVDEAALTPGKTVTIDNSAGGDLFTTGVKLSEFGITNADKDATLKLAFNTSDQTATVQDGLNLNTATLKATISAVTGAYEYEVTVKNLDNAKAAVTSATQTAFKAQAVALTSDVTITKADVEVKIAEQVLAIDAAKTTWTPASVTIVFTEKVDAAEANDKANYTLTQGDGRTGASITKAVLQDDGVTVILTVAGTALSIDTTADTIDVGAAVTSARTAANALTADTITLAADGKVTVA